MILGYARVSTSQQDAEGATSMQTQENIIRGYALAQGVDKFGIQMYQDVGESGATPLKYRKAGEQLIADVQPGDTVIASKLDRIFRNCRDALETAEAWHKKGIKLVLYDLGTEPVLESSTAKLFFTMLSAFAGFERERIVERILSGKRAKAAQGGHTGGPAPFGMKLVGYRRTSRLEPNPEEQELARLIKQKYRDYGSVGKVTRLINHQGHRTRTGQPFVYTQVKRIIEQKTIQ